MPKSQVERGRALLASHHLVVPPSNSRVRPFADQKFSCSVALTAVPEGDTEPAEPAASGGRGAGDESLPDSGGGLPIVVLNSRSSKADRAVTSLWMSFVEL
jgi:hypothetical protein